MDYRLPISCLANVPAPGQEIYDLAAELFPINRSLTGAGVRQSLELLKRHVPLQIREVATGTKVFDWEVPREWTIRDAYVKDASGRRVIDFRNCNLHVVGYSRPIHTTVSLPELKRHIFTLPDQPDLIPYRTSYYAEFWGFCMSQTQLDSLDDGDYEVLIDATLEDGQLTYGEYLLEGQTQEEVLLSAHICHPSLANDNCSGLALLAILAKYLKDGNPRFSYRFLFAPGTIGAITWLARNEANVSRIKHGLVMSCVGDGGGPTYKKSRRGNAVIDQAMCHVLRHSSPAAAIQDFTPYGYDERQYCSPAFDLPVGLFQRSQYGTFPEYHTSADDLQFIRPHHLGVSFQILTSVLEVLEEDRHYLNLSPKCEPQLGRRGLYSAIGGDQSSPEKSMAMLWVLNLSDGSHTLLDIAERAALPFAIIREAASLLKSHGLLAPCPDPGAA